MTSHLPTAALLGLGLVLHVVIARPDEHRMLAEEIVGRADRVPLPGPPAFVAGERAVLFFDCEGLNGPIHGAVVVSGDRISDVLILRAREGLLRTALASPRFTASFREQPVAQPVVADAVSGATISCQAVTDAVNDRLSVWRARAGTGNDHPR